MKVSMFLHRFRETRMNWFFQIPTEKLGRCEKSHKDLLVFQNGLFVSLCPSDLSWSVIASWLPIARPISLRNSRRSLEQWFLTFFGLWTPKSQKNFGRTPNLSKCTIGGPMNTCKRGLKGYNSLLLWSLRSP